MKNLRNLFDLEGQIIKKRRRILNKYLEKEGLYFAQPKILRIIETNPECDQNTLAKELGSSKASVTCSVKRLEKAGLIKKEVSLKDMRHNILRLTDLGKEKSKKADEILMNTVLKQFEDFSEEEIEIILKLYEKINLSLDKEDIL